MARYWWSKPTCKAINYLYWHFDPFQGLNATTNRYGHNCSFNMPLQDIQSELKRQERGKP